MARKSADPNARLRKYLAVRKAAKTIDVLNAEEMAKVLAMTWRNLRYIIDADPDFPIQHRGAEGEAWEFRATKVLDHLIARCRAEIRANASKARRLAELAGVVVEDDDVGMSLADLRQINLLQMDAQRRKMDQGEYVRATEVRALFTGFFTLLQSEHQSVTAKIDPAGKLPPDIRAAISDQMRSVLVRVHKKFGELIKDDVAPDRRAGAGVSRARPGGALRKRA